MSPAPAAVRELFRSRFGGTADGVWLAPGRANLMGEHTDYNEGFVLPFALGQGIVAAAARRADRRLVLCSAQEPGCAADVALDGLAPGQVTGWAAYPAGVAWALAAAGYQVPGACLAIDSDVPAGAGLSSSAALECVTALALTELAGLSVDRRELAAIARRAENDFAGVPSGIMDQSASLLSQRGHALLLDCRSLESCPGAVRSRRVAAAPAADQHPGPSRAGAGEYGQRRAECEQAARLLGVPSLRYLTDLADVDRLTDPVLRRRARHVVTDNQRVLEVVGSADGSAAGDAYPEIGRLLTQAHGRCATTSRSPGRKRTWRWTRRVDAGALGARMIGGGFGGSVLALVGEDAVGPVRAAVAEAFAGRSWTAPEFLDAAPSASARRLGLG